MSATTEEYVAEFEDERLRVKELFKFFHATSQAIGRIEQDADSEETCTPPGLARLSSDPALNAFAQLGAQRMNCDRSFISLIDRQKQYIISEASRTISLYDGNHHKPGDQLAFGETELDLFTGVC